MVNAFLKILLGLFFTNSHSFKLCRSDIFEMRRNWPKTKYWDDPRIHAFGNSGWSGRIHAMLAPSITKLIDNRAYGGIDIRKDINKQLQSDGGYNYTSVDFACGTGMSTHERSIGVDTSKEMLDIARYRTERPNYLHKPPPSYSISNQTTTNDKTLGRFFEGNVEGWGDDKSFDLVTCMFAFHEMPQYARQRVLQNAMRVARHRIVIVDISPDYIPSKSMLSGEPYVLEYLENIDKNMESVNGTYGFILQRNTIVDGHVTMWDFVNES